MSKFEVFFAHVESPKDGELVMTARRPRCYNEDCDCWDDVDGDDYADAIEDAPHWSYDTRAQSECAEEDKKLKEFRKTN